MKTNQFIALLVGTVGCLLFSMGMCMCLMPEWNAFLECFVVTAAAGVILTALTTVSILKTGKNRKPIKFKIV